MSTQVQERIRLIQEALREERLEGWLLYNFRGSNVFATRILELPPHIIQTRRYFYFIPAKGSPKKLDQTTEYDVQQFMLSEFKRRGLKTEEAPNCSVNANSANPHYEPTRELNRPLNRGDFVLIDLWAKKDKPRSVYADITWTGYIGETVPAEYAKVFEVVKGGRDAALRFVQQSYASGTEIYGCQVDDAARRSIEQHGYGESFVHRTGHSIGEEIHGNGANMDNLETRDERKVIARTSFSIEPGIYLPGKFGIRSEIDVYISKSREVIVTGLPMQDAVVPILK